MSCQTVDIKIELNTGIIWWWNQKVSFILYIVSAYKDKKKRDIYIYLGYLHYGLSHLFFISFITKPRCNWFYFLLYSLLIPFVLFYFIPEPLDWLVKRFSCFFLSKIKEDLSDSKSNWKLPKRVGKLLACCWNLVNCLFISSGKPFVWIDCESEFMLEVTVEKRERPNRLPEVFATLTN